MSDGVDGLSPDDVPPTAEALQEALALSEELLREVELSENPLSNLALKASRLARLLNDVSTQETMRYEVGGYPGDGGTGGAIRAEAFELAVKAGRLLPAQPGMPARIFVETIPQLEESILTTRLRLQAAADPNISISSANPHQFVLPNDGNKVERLGLQNVALRLAGQLSSRRTFIHDYVLHAHYRLKFSGVASDVFSRTRERVDSSIGALVPDAIQKLVAIHDNLRSQNPEDWANAVHGCRRLLQAVADALFPARTDRLRSDERPIRLGPDNYINRLVCYVDDQSESARFEQVAGSNLKFLGDRLDAIFLAAQKGSHAAVSKEDADRYFIYTYLVVGDILSLAGRAPPVGG